MEGKPVTYASIEMIRLIFGFPPEEVRGAYFDRFAERLEEYDPGAERSHQMAERFRLQKRFPKE